MKRYLIIADIISALLLLMMAYASVSKLADLHNFQQALSQSPLFGKFAPVIAWLLPLSEIAVAALLIVPFTRTKGLYASFLLLALFTFYLIFIVLMYKDLPCNCGGVLKALTWPQHIFLNLILIFFSAIGILLHKKHRETMKATPP